MKKILALAGALAMLAAVSTAPAKAGPQVVVVPAWVVVATIGTVVVGMVAASATARKRGCHWATIQDVNGNAESVYICEK